MSARSTRVVSSTQVRCDDENQTLVAVVAGARVAGAFLANAGSYVAYATANKRIEHYVSWVWK